MSISMYVLAPLVLVLSDSWNESDWPQWRGPGRDAISPEVGLIQAWPVGGPEVVWRIEVGDGYSGMAVAQGRLYTLWDDEQAQVLACVDAVNGEILWTTPVGAGFRHGYGNGPRSTPLVDGDLVFAVDTSGRLLAADRHTGEPVWEHDLVRELAARLPAYGYASSPLVVGDRLLVETAGAEAAYSAFDTRTGERLWSAGEDAAAYASPLRVTLGGVDQVLFWSAAGLHAVTPDGEQLWSHPWRTDCPATGDPLGTGSPLFVAPDKLFLSSGSGTALLHVERTGEALEAHTDWESKVLRNDVNSSLLLEDHVYGFDAGTLKCVDVRTGKTRWGTRDYRKGSLIAADGQLIVLGEQGEVALVEARPEGFVEKSRASVLKGKSWTSPTLARGRLYLRNHDEMVCLNMRRRDNE